MIWMIHCRYERKLTLSGFLMQADGPVGTAHYYRGISSSLLKVVKALIIEVLG